MDQIVSVAEAIKSIICTLRNQKPGKPWLLRITGGGASGKSLFSEEILKAVGEPCDVLVTDTYLLSPEVRRATEKGTGERLTASHPDSIFLPALVRDMSMLCSGLELWTVPDEHTPSKLLRAGTSVVVEGIGAAFLAPSFFDLSVFLSCSREVEYQRRIQRDVNQRNVALETVRSDFEVRRRQFEQYIFPLRHQCEWVFSSRQDGMLQVIKADINN